jgi:hypothetical protein
MLHALPDGVDVVIVDRPQLVVDHDSALRLQA